MEQFEGLMVSQACILKILKIHFRIFILFQFGISGSSRPTRQTREYRRIGTYDVIVMTPKLFCATSFSLNYCHHLFLSCSFDSWLQSRHYFATVHVIMKMPRYLARPRVVRKKKISESCYGRVGVVRVYVLPSIVFGTKLFPLVIGYVLNYSRIVFKQNFHS